MSSYTETREAYAKNRTLSHLTEAELVVMERSYLDQITWIRWRGTPAEIACARVQAELSIRERQAKSIAA